MTARPLWWIAVAKTLTYRVTSTVTTFGIAWAVTGDAGTGAAIGGAELLAKTVLYWCHERAWTAALAARAV